MCRELKSEWPNLPAIVKIASYVAMKIGIRPESIVVFLLPKATIFGSLHSNSPGLGKDLGKDLGFGLGSFADLGGDRWARMQTTTK